MLKAVSFMSFIFFMQTQSLLTEVTQSVLQILGNSWDWSCQTKKKLEEYLIAFSSFPRVFNRIAVAKAASPSGIIILGEILSRTAETCSLTVKLLVYYRMDGVAWSSYSILLSSKLRINWNSITFAATAILLWLYQVFKQFEYLGGPAHHTTSGRTARFAALSYKRPSTVWRKEISQISRDNAGTLANNKQARRKVTEKVKAEKTRLER